MQRNRRFEILVVEDDPGACYLMETALKDTEIDHHVTCVHDGGSASDLLHRIGVYASAALPDLIFLDLHLPGKSGWEVLKEIKSDPILRRIPVIVLSSSSEQAHVDSAYDLHANCYLQKAGNWNDLCKQIRSVEEFWFAAVLWPTAARATGA